MTVPLMHTEVGPTKLILHYIFFSNLPNISQTADCLSSAARREYSFTDERAASWEIPQVRPNINKKQWQVA